MCSDLFGSVRTCLDTFGYAWMLLNQLGCIWRFSEYFRKSLIFVHSGCFGTPRLLRKRFKSNTIYFRTSVRPWEEFGMDLDEIETDTGRVRTSLGQVPDKFGTDSRRVRDSFGILHPRPRHEGESHKIPVAAVVP